MSAISEKDGGHITKFLPAVIDFSGGQVDTEKDEERKVIRKILQESARAIQNELKDGEKNG